MLAFNWFFLPPVHTFTLSDSRNWFALAVYLVTAVVVSGLAAGARRRATEAEQREVETAAPGRRRARCSGAAQSTRSWAARRGPAGVLGVEVGLGARGAAAPRSGERARGRGAGPRRVGTLVVEEASRRWRPGGGCCRRSPSLLAVAVDRSGSSDEAFDAEALRRTDTVKTAVLRAVSHDLRSPLTAIRASDGPASQPDSRSRDDDQARSCGDDQRRGAAARAGGRQPARAVAAGGGRGGAAPGGVAVDDLIGRRSTRSPRTPTVWRSRVRPTRPPVLVDAVQVRQILGNLVDNALKFSPAGLRRHRPGHPHAQGGDRPRRRPGPGLPASELEHVFEPFYRGARRPDRHRAGLAIARGFAEANGGRLWAESRPARGPGSRSRSRRRRRAAGD